ncbi:MAG TPA: alpha/beta fold hydrolase [Kofleriaceae bacterium]|jgi:medium-chain acyl-[acyl-carrier-protein] hydrolase|nr:alpha/beta fold hydrolase [Kofleriaceae bacterium]
MPPAIDRFVRPRPVARPALRVIVFHHAGGAAAMYHGMAAALPADWELLVLDLPGRGKRSGEPLVDELPGLLPRVVADVLPVTDVPFAVFGHSLGAILAAEVARALEQRGIAPVWVGISGRVAPSQPFPRLSAMDDSSLLAQLAQLGGTPVRALDNPELRARLLRVVRADIALLETYAPAADRAPIASPVTLFAGTSDPWAAPAAMAPWADETSGRCHTRLYPGGHFFLLEAGLAAFTRDLAAEIQHARHGALAA